MTTILSIQSSVAYGYVGNSAAVFPLQRLGVEVWPVLTVHFSNHKGYESWYGPVLPAGEIAAVIRGIEERGAFRSCDAVLSGYQGSTALGGVIVDTVDRVRAANPAALYCCDPVMGDVGGLYVTQELAAFIRDEAVPRANIITPNQFELDFLAGGTTATLGEVLEAAATIRARGPATILVTSLVRREAPSDRIEVLASTGEGAWIVSTPRLPISVNGAGDVMSALFLAHHLSGCGTAEALRRTVNSVYAVLEATAVAGRREICVIEAQAAIAQPPDRFPVIRAA